MNQRSVVIMILFLLWMMPAVVSVGDAQGAGAVDDKVGYEHGCYLSLVYDPTKNL